MTDDDLINQIEHLERQALGYYSGHVATEQAKALDYYNGKPFGTEEEGRSAVVSSDVWDVVEGLTPIVLKPFVASEDVVRFNPLGPDDEEAAEQESDYINWVVTQRNGSFNELTAWVKNGLLQKNGVVKYWWEKSKRAKVERYYGVEDDVLDLLKLDKSVEIVEQTTTEEMTEAGPTRRHDITLRTVEEVGFAKYRVIPPEEFLIDRSADSPDPQAARFVQHRARKTIAELRDMGYDVDADLADHGQDDASMSEQYVARRAHDESIIEGDEGLDPTQREVTLRETYLLIDADGDGEAELRKVCIVGRKILANDETEEIPFCAWTPYPQPHKFYGRCPADETLEIQLIKSTLWRQTLDNIYTINNNRVYANEDVNLDDLIDNQIAGVVRIKSKTAVNQAVMPAPITPIGQVVQPMIEYLDSAKENRTGFTRYNQGTDAGSLNKTATGIRIITEGANNRVELIARAFAEQGLAPLMRGIHGLCQRHATKDEVVRLRGKWVQVDPRSWKRRMDVSVAVGLGTADQQMKLQGIQMLMMEQKALAQAGIVQPEHMLAGATKLVEALGFKNPEQYFGGKQDQGLPPEAQAALQQASQQMQAMQQRLQELESGVAQKQIEAQGKVSVEAMKIDSAHELEAMKQQFGAFLQQMKDQAALDRQEMAGWVTLLSKQVAPPQQLAEEVSDDMEQDGQA